MTAATKDLTFLVLSDVHYGKYAVNRAFGSSDESADEGTQMEENLVETVRRDHPNLDGILVAGDLTSVASPSEFLGCTKIIESIRDKLDVQANRVFHTYGNHDVDWQVSSLSRKTIENGAKLKPRGILEEAYQTIAAHIGELLCKNSGEIESGPVPGSGVFRSDDFDLFIINSGYFCSSEQDWKHGKIGSDQLEWLEHILKVDADSKKWRIAMTHHHPFNYKYPIPVPDFSCIEEGAEIVDLLGKHAIDILIHGHRHHPRLQPQLQHGWVRPVTFFCAGSLAVDPRHRDTGRIPNLFHVLNLQKRTESGGAFGVLTTYEYSSSQLWRPIQNKPETPIDHQQYFGVIATETERLKAATEFIATHVLANTGSDMIVIAMPFNWPPILACCHLTELVATLKTAAIGAGYKMINALPETLVLSRQ